MLGFYFRQVYRVVVVKGCVNVATILNGVPFGIRMTLCNRRLNLVICLLAKYWLIMVWNVVRLVLLTLPGIVMRIDIWESNALGLLTVFRMLVRYANWGLMPLVQRRGTPGNDG